MCLSGTCPAQECGQSWLPRVEVAEASTTSHWRVLHEVGKIQVTHQIMKDNVLFEFFYSLFFFFMRTKLLVLCYVSISHFSQ